MVSSERLGKLYYSSWLTVNQCIELHVAVKYHIEEQGSKVGPSGQLGLTITFYIISAVQEKNIVRYRDTILNLKQKAHGYQTGSKRLYLSVLLFGDYLSCFSNILYKSHVTGHVTNCHFVNIMTQIWTVFMEAPAFLVEALVWYVVYKKTYKEIIVYKLFKLAGKFLITYCWDYFTKMSTNVTM